MQEQFASSWGAPPRSTIRDVVDQEEDGQEGTGGDEKYMH